jgi:hypothetical protein
MTKCSRNLSSLLKQYSVVSMIAYARILIAGLFFPAGSMHFNIQLDVVYIVTLLDLL